MTTPDDGLFSTTIGTGGSTTAANSASFQPGAIGGLMGTNVLMQSVEANTRAITNLASQFSRAVGGNNIMNQGRGSAAPWAAAVQGTAAFPGMQNPFMFTQQGPVGPTLANNNLIRPGTQPSPFPGLVNPFSSFPRRGVTSSYPQLGASTGNFNAGAVTTVPGFPGLINPFTQGFPTVGPTSAVPNYSNQSNGFLTFGQMALQTGQRLGGINGLPNQGFPVRGPVSPATPPPPPRNYGGAARVIGGTLGAVAAAAVLFGSGMLNDQIVANAYTSAAQTAAPIGTNVNNLARYQAFGAAGRNLNGISFNTQDAAQGAATLGFVGGYVPGTQMGANGRAVNSSFNAIGYANPGLGAAGSAALTSTMYSQQMAMQMRALGYANTPRTMNGTFQGMGQNVQSLLNRWYGGANSVSQKNLISTLSQGGAGTINLQAAGYTPQQVSQLTPVIETYNKLFNQGLNANQANSLINSASRGSQASMLAAQDRLAGYGIQKSDLQALKDRSAVRTGNTSDVSGGYNAALQESVKLLGDFNQMLNNIMRATGTTGIVGGLGGVGGASSTLVHGGSLVGLGALAARYGAARAGAGAAAAAAGGGAGAGAGGAAAGGAGVGIGARIAGAAGGTGAVVGTAGVAALLYGLTKVHNPDGTTWLDEGPGGKKSAWNSWSTIGHDLGIGGGGLAGAIRSKLGGSPNSQPNIGGGAAGFKPTPGGSQGSPKGGKQSVGGSVSSAAVHAVHAAEQEIGKPYVFGGDSPSVGFDCSGLVEWSYGQAGVNLPRTSQAQWAALSRKSIALDKVQEGDIVFQAGSDGTAASPGHEAMMINKRQIVEAAHTGTNIWIRSYNPHEWQHAARPTGSVLGAGGPSGPYPMGGGGAGSSSLGGMAGNTGLGGGIGSGMSFGGSESDIYGSGDEMSMLSGGFIGGGSVGAQQGGTNVPKGNTPGSGTGGAVGKGGKGRTANLSGNKRIMNNWASKFGWGRGREWQALNTLEMHEAGYNNTIKNPSSTAYGMGQFLDSTWATVGGHKTSDPNLQAKYMMEYIKERYGDPIKAWAQYYQHPGGIGWYGSGGNPRHGEVALVGERGPELVQFGTGGKVMDAGKTSEILAGMNSLTQQVGSLPGKTTSHSGATVNLNFAAGSIVMSGGAHNDSANAARVFLRRLKKELENEHVYMVIAEGEKN